MSRNCSPTRREFLARGAFLALPAGATLIPAVALADDALHARVKRLEDEAAIRDLHQSWLRQVHRAGGDARLEPSLRRVLPDQAGAPDTVEFSADGASAIGSYDCLVETETSLCPDCTLAQMAHVQGHGATRSTERRRLRLDYIKSAGSWKIARVTAQPL